MKVEPSPNLSDAFKKEIARDQAMLDDKNFEKAMESVVFLTTRGWTCIAPKAESLPNGPWDKGYQSSGIQPTQDCSTCSSDCKLYSGCYVGNIHKAATDLVDAVERYVKQGCLRSELIIKTKALKKLL